ncbi:MAG: hypothetical protein N3B21_08215 [Clostridia bacterium]|nr:hypothetical protein [Clostridia bacterium]
MSNVMWYIGLAAISMGIAAYAIYMKRDTYKISTFIVFYIFASAITWIGEFIVLGLFNSYAYKTGLFQNPWAQNLLGHLFLNASMFPAAATVMVAYSLRYGYFALVAVIFVLIEYIFVKLGLYEQHWWRYYMSAINVVLFLLITKKWFSKMNQERCGLTRTIIFYFVAFLIIHIPTPILLLLGKQHYQLGLINNLARDFYLSSTIIAFTNHLIISSLVVFFVCILKKWYWKIAAYIIALIVQTTYAKMNIFIIHGDWKLIYYLLIQVFCITTFILIEKYTLKPNKNCLKTNR